MRHRGIDGVLGHIAPRPPVVRREPRGGPGPGLGVGGLVLFWRKGLFERELESQALISFIEPIQAMHRE